MRGWNRMSRVNVIVGGGCRLQKVVEGVEGVKRLRSGCS